MYWTYEWKVTPHMLLSTVLTFTFANTALSDFTSVGSGAKGLHFSVSDVM